LTSKLKPHLLEPPPHPQLRRPGFKDLDDDGEEGSESETTAELSSVGISEDGERDGPIAESI